MSKVFKAVKKVIKPIASIALPIAASFIPGVGPLGMALAGAAGGALGGGGLKGALLGGALSGLGAGMFGAAPGAGTSTFSSLNNGLYNSMSPLRSIGSSITSGIGDFLSPLQTAFGGASSGSQSMIPSTGLPSLSGSGSAAAPSVAPAIEAATAAGSDPGLLGQLMDAIKNPTLNTLSNGAALLSALNPQQPEGTISQREIYNQMQADKAKQTADNEKFIAGLNSGPLTRARTNPTIDYYNYGSRPEQTFFDNVAAEPIKFKKGGEVSSPLSSIGGQDDAVDAKLSVGEFVIPADVVSHLGDGNTDAGAKKLQQLLKQIRKHKAPALKKGALPPKAKSPLAYIGAAA